MNTKTKKYRIKSTFRFTLFIIIAIIVIGAAITTGLGLNTATGLSKERYIEIQVQSGDTLWTIASEYMSPDIDTRKNVQILCEKNNVTAETLYPGQTIRIPEEI